jgi:hypothetical protein
VIVLLLALRSGLTTLLGVVKHLGSAGLKGAQVAEGLADAYVDTGAGSTAPAASRSATLWISSAATPRLPEVAATRPCRAARTTLTATEPRAEAAHMESSVESGRHDRS